MGAQRWLDLTLFQLQPSEIMKIVMVMALARYFHGLEVGDAAFFLAGKPATFEGVAGRARTVIGEELKITNSDSFEFAWIVDFPMYEKDSESGRIDFSHNPFSMPQGGMAALDAENPETI